LASGGLSGQVGLPVFLRILIIAQLLEALGVVVVLDTAAGVPRWNTYQRYLIKGLAVLGGDPAAQYTNRVLWLVNSVTRKRNEV